MASKRVRELEPEALPMPEATRYSGISRSRLYELMESGEITFFKNGTRRLIFRTSLLDYMWSRPKTSGVCHANIRRG